MDLDSREETDSGSTFLIQSDTFLNQQLSAPSLPGLQSPQKVHPPTHGGTPEKDLTCLEAHS